jgi:hypothetical protein
MNHDEQAMNHDEHPDDSSLIAELVDSLAEVAVPERPPLTAMTTRGRVHRRRRLAGLAGIGGTGAAAVIALVLGLAGVFGAAPAGGTGTVETAAFTLTSYANGTVSLKLGQLFDPAALQRALAQHGIPALVKNDTYCSSSLAAPNPLRDGVLPGWGTPPPGVRGILMSGNFPVKPSQLAPSVDPVTAVINPAAMPPGTELFIGYYDLGHTFFLDLIYTSSHTCSNGKPPALARLDRPPSAGHS